MLGPPSFGKPDFCLSFSADLEDAMADGDFTGIWESPKIRVTLFWVLIIRILLFNVLYSGPLFLETTI